MSRPKPPGSNPYQAPDAKLGGLADDALQSVALGDLDQALSGAHTLDAAAVLKEGWRLVAGSKLAVHIAYSILGLVYFGVIFGLMAFFLRDITLEMLADAPALTARLTALAEDPGYMLTMTAVVLPLNAWMYAATWNMGLQRAAGHPLRVAHAFPMAVVPKAMVVLLPGALVGLLGLIHPTLGYASTPVSFLLLLAIPACIDRNMGVVEAIRTSAALVSKNLLAMILVAMALGAGYVASFATCGIGLLWYMPWAVMVFGAVWRQLAGFEGIEVVTEAT